MKYLALIALLLFPLAASAESEFRFFKDKPLYEAPLAYSRSSSTGLFFATSRYKGSRVLYLEGSIGREIPVVTWYNNVAVLQLGIESTTWFTLGYPQDELYFPLLTQDFHFAIPASVQYKNLTVAIKYNHISAHQGDGFDDAAQESLSQEEKEEFEQKEKMGENAGVDVSLTRAESYSRDYISLHFSHKYWHDGFRTRSYFHAGYAHKMVPDTLNRWFIGGGTETKRHMGKVTPFFAQDITWNGDTNSVDLSVKFGVIFAEDRNNLFNVGVAVRSFVGRDRRGQLIKRKKMKEFGIGIFAR